MSPAELALVPPPMVAGVLLTPDQVAKRLAVSRSMIYQLIKRGQLAAIFIGRCPRVSETELQRFLTVAAARS